MSTISVIVPVYNVGAFLRPCLDSLAAQTHRDLQVLLVDDGSTDGSGAVCDAYSRADSRFTVLHLQNGGVSAARAAGLRQATGDYIGFSDADDLLHPGFFAMLLAALETSGLPVAACPYQSFTGAAPSVTPLSSKIETFTAPAHLQALLQDKRVDYGLWNKLYRAGVLTPAMLENDLRYNEDLLANWQALRPLPGLALCESAGYFYRQNAASATHTLRAESIEQQWQVAKRIRDDARGTDLSAMAGAYYYEKLLYLDSMILRQDNAADFAPQHKRLLGAIRAGYADAARSPALAAKWKALGLAAGYASPAYAALCRRLLTDRR